MLSALDLSTILIIATFEKTSRMSAPDLKKELHEQIDALDNTHLEEVYGLVLNYLESAEASSAWTKLSLAQQEGITKAIHQLDAGNAIPHNAVMESIAKRYKKP
jgi:hypothetical protein